MGWLASLDLRQPYTSRILSHQIATGWFLEGVYYRLGSRSHPPLWDRAGLGEQLKINAKKQSRAQMDSHLAPQATGGTTTGGTHCHWQAAACCIRLQQAAAAQDFWANLDPEPLPEPSGRCEPLRFM